jgi:predicted nucleic acid-binding protein
MNASPTTPQLALDAWAQLGDDPRVLYVEAEPVAHEKRFAALVSGRQATPNLWSDAWLAALALSLDCEIATFDRGFKSFRGLKLRMLTAA